MKAYGKRLLSDAATYGVGDTLQKALAFLAAPVLTRLLTPADYGTLELLLAFVTFATPLILLGLDTALQSIYLDPEVCPDRYARKCLVSSTLWFLAAWGAILGGLGWETAPLVAWLIFAGTVSAEHLRLAVFVTLATVLWWFGRYLLRLQFRAQMHTGLSVVGAAANLGIGVLILGVLNQGLDAYYAAYGAVLFVGGIVGLYAIRHEIGLCFQWSLAWKAVLLGLPYVPATMIYVVMSLMDRVMLNLFVPLEHLGWYAIAFRVASAMHVGVAMFALAWSPLAIKMYYEARDEALAFYRRVLTYVVALGGLAALALAALAPGILWIMAPAAYAPAAAAVGPLAIAAVALAASHVTTLGPVLARRPLYMPLLVALALALGAVANLVLIPRWGIVGAAWAAVVVQGFLAGSAGVVTGRLLRPFQYDWRSLLVLGALIVAGTVAIGQTKSVNPIVEAGLNALILASYAVALGLLGMLRRAHAQMMYNSGVHRLIRVKTFLGGLRSTSLPEQTR